MTQLKRSLDYFLPADAQNREFAISYPRARRYKYEYEPGSGPAHRVALRA